MNHKELYNIADELGACKEGLQAIHSASEREIIAAYKKYIEFSIDKSWPSFKYIKEHFDEELLRENDVYVLEDVNIASGSGVIILNECNGNVGISDFSVSTIYVRGNSKVKIDCSGFSKAHVYVYDNASVEVSSSDLSHVFCIKYGTNARIVATDNVIVKEKK